MENHITVNNVIKRYGPVTAVNDVSFEVKKGEILGFLGPNGAGKTTLMRILTGYFPPSEGTVTVDSLDFEDKTLAIKKKIGYLPEHVPLYHEMTVESFLRYVAEAKDVAVADRRAHIDRVIHDCGLDAMRFRAIGKLSKGYRQRVGLAQALVGDPDILILDEPTTGLDPKQIIEIRGLIKNMAGNKTVILSTHILPEVSVICDRVIIINEGKIVAIDTPANLEHRLSSGVSVRLQVRGDSDRISEALAKLDGVDSVELCVSSSDVADCVTETAEFLVSCADDVDVRPAIAKELTKHFDLLEMRTVRLSLEDIFVKLVTEEGGTNA